MSVLKRNAIYWAGYCRDGYAPALQYFADALADRLLPQFSNLNNETERFAEEEYKRLGSLPGDPEIDMADIAEQATDLAVSWYLSMTAVRQSIINLFAIGLRHLFEQQVFDFVSHAHISNAVNADFHRDIGSLTVDGIDVKQFQSWSRLEELRLVCNTVKHAEGGSARELKALRPEFFQSPGESALSILTGPGPVRQPMAGEDVFLAVEDIHTYCEAARHFWNELAEKLEES